LAGEIPGCDFDESFEGVFRAVEESSRTVLGIGGYLTGTSGGDPSPETSSLRLAMLRTTPDAGLVHFSIPEDDLKRGRLNRAKFIWNDWDS
jgi:hypothetical protein